MSVVGEPSWADNGVIHSFPSRLARNALEMLLNIEFIRKGLAVRRVRITQFPATAVDR